MSAVHLARPDWRAAQCGVPWTNARMTDDLNAVTCERCRPANPKEQ